MRMPESWSPCKYYSIPVKATKTDIHLQIRNDPDTEGVGALRRHAKCRRPPKGSPAADL
jgi:hypothetical protein